MFRIVRFVARLTPKYLLGKSLCYCSLRACHSHSTDSVKEKSESESTLSNVWSLRRLVHRAIPVSLTLIFFFDWSMSITVNASRLIANKKTLIDISEPVMWHVYRSTHFLVQQLSLQRLNADVRSNNNALKEFNDCIGGLLHWGPNVITFRTVTTFRPSTMCTSSPFCSPIEPITMTPPNSHRSSWCLAEHPCYSSRQKSGQTLAVLTHSLTKSEMQPLI